MGRTWTAFYPYNSGALSRYEELRWKRKPFNTKEMGNFPCTPMGCIELIDRCGVDMSGKHVVVFGRSNIVGSPAALMCIHKNATVVVCHSRTQNIADECLMATSPLLPWVSRSLSRETGLKRARLSLMLESILCPTILESLATSVWRRGIRRGREECSAHQRLCSCVGPRTIAMLMRNTLQMCERCRGGVIFVCFFKYEV